jgi:hypothetical protein
MTEEQKTQAKRAYGQLVQAQVSALTDKARDDE